jgi:hypothetical protein
MAAPLKLLFTQASRHRHSSPLAATAAFSNFMASLEKKHLHFLQLMNVTNPILYRNLSTFCAIWAQKKFNLHLIHTKG